MQQHLAPLLHLIDDFDKSFEICVICVLNHSPAYHFQDLPAPLIKVEQIDGLPVCFWPQFDWHVMFASAITRANPQIGFICIRPDERASAPVWRRLNDHVTMVHMPSEMKSRLQGAMCIEESETIFNFLHFALERKPFLLMIMGIGSNFGREILIKISNSIKNLSIVGYAAGDIPSIYSKHKLSELFFSNRISDKLRFVKHGIERFVGIEKERSIYGSLAHLWAPTDSSHRHWREVVQCPISFAPGGYGYDEKLWKPGDKLKARNELNLPHDIPIILSSSVLIPKKNIDQLIYATAIVSKSIGEVKLIISGYGEKSEEQRLYDIACQLSIENNVHFTGYVVEQDLVRYYQAADVFVHLSAVEGGPASAMQALATNTPLVMTPVGCVGELLKISNLGSLFPIGNISICAEKIIDAINSRKLSDTAIIAQKLYAWQLRGAEMAKDLEAAWGRSGNDY